VTLPRKGQLGAHFSVDTSLQHIILVLTIIPLSFIALGTMGCSDGFRLGAGYWNADDL
jgi:hypothetical protein